MALTRLVSVMFVSTVTLLHAQVNTGTITGTVTDSSGATVPNVKVTVVHTDTNFQSVAQTNSEGLYRVHPFSPAPTA